MPARRADWFDNFARSAKSSTGSDELVFRDFSRQSTTDEKVLTYTAKRTGRKGEKAKRTGIFCLQLGAWSVGSCCHDGRGGLSDGKDEGAMEEDL